MDWMDSVQEYQLYYPFHFLFFFGYWKFYISYILLSTIGALLAFLIFNFYPAKIFMGDTGSLFLGSLFSMIIMILMYHIPEEWFSFLILFTYPILDLLLSVVRRFLGKKISLQQINYTYTYY